MAKKAAASKPKSTEDRIADALTGVDVTKIDCDVAYKRLFPNEVALHQFRNEWSKKVAEKSKPSGEDISE